MADSNITAAPHPDAEDGAEDDGDGDNATTTPDDDADTGDSDSEPDLNALDEDHKAAAT